MKTVEENGGALEFYENRQYGLLSLFSIFVIAVSLILFFVWRKQSEDLFPLIVVAGSCLGLVFVWWSRSRDRLLLTIDKDGIYDLKHGKIPWSNIVAIEYYVAGNRPRTSYIGFIFADGVPRVQLSSKWQMQTSTVVGLEGEKYQYSLRESDLPINRIEFKKLLISKFPEIAGEISFRAF